MSVSNSSLPFAVRLHHAGSAIRRLPSRLLRFAALSRSRRGLLMLDDHLLRDIGLTRSEAMAEAQRAAWDAPSHWKG